MTNRLLVVLAGILVLASGGSAQAPYVEFDLDGVLGNAPDQRYVSVNDLVAVDMWAFGPPLYCMGFYDLIVCNPEHGLAYMTCQYHLPSGWIGIPPLPPDPDSCIVVQGIDFTGLYLMMLPWRLSTVTYRAAEDGTINTLVSAYGSVINTTGFSEPSFINNEVPLAYVHIGTIGTEATSWGSIKTMFK